MGVSVLYDPDCLLTPRKESIMPTYAINAKILLDANSSDDAIAQVMLAHDRIAIGSWREVAADEAHRTSPSAEARLPDVADNVKQIDKAIIDLIGALATVQMYCWIQIWQHGAQNTPRALRLVESLPGDVHERVNRYDADGAPYEIESRTIFRGSGIGHELDSKIEAQWSYPVEVESDS